MNTSDRQIIKTVFQLKRAQAQVWESLNPTLAAGEPGFELDTGKMKIGDGNTPWLQLNYIANDNTITMKPIDPANIDAPPSAAAVYQAIQDTNQAIQNAIGDAIGGSY